MTRQPPASNARAVMMRPARELATDWLVGAAFRTGRLVSILAEWRVADEGAIFLVTPSGAGRASGTRALCDWLTAHFKSPPWYAENITYAR
jgi:DNA-binding transcriptional LysR family regulator